jgi:hypothetical protein
MGQHRRPDRTSGAMADRNGDRLVIKTLGTARCALRGGTALKALALLGAGVTATLLASPAAAQDYSQVNATGRVLSTGGEPIAGATISVRSVAQGFNRTVTTAGDGTYRISALPQGAYEFTIAAEGFDSFVDPAVTLTQAGAANQFTLSATGDAGGGDIVVRAGRLQTVDFDRNTTGAVINVGDLATRVPVARDITSVILLAPGTQLGDTAFGNVPAINGSSVSENAYFLNGLNITNFTTGIGANTVPFDFYQTVEVKTGGISAEFGRFDGGFINATSKSGSNEFHGGITFNYEPDDLRAKAPNTYATDNDSRISERREMIVQLSGPIIKDHLFFYGLYNSRNVISAVGSTGAVSATATGANGCASNPRMCANYQGPSTAGLALVGTAYTRATTNSPFFGGKIDAVIVDGQRLEFTYFDTTNETREDTYGNATYTLASGRRYNPNTNSPGGYGRYTGTFTNWLTLSGAYGRSYQTGDVGSSTPNFPSIVDARAGTSVSIGNPSANSVVEDARREFYRFDGDLFFNFLGSHHIRGGYDRENLRDTSQTVANGNYQYTYFNSGANGDTNVSTPNTQYVRRRFFRNGGTFTTKAEAFYIQDSWSGFGNRLNITAGVRNDTFTNANADNEAFFDSKDNWGPRLSASFDPIGDGQTKIYGSFGRYYLPVATNTNVRLAGPELDYSQFYILNGTNSDNTPILGAPVALTNAAATTCPSDTIDFGTGTASSRNCTINNDGTSPPYRSLVSSSLKAQSVDDYQLGIEQRIGSLIRFGAFYTQRDLRESLEDGYIDAGVQAYCRRTQTGAVLQSCLQTFSGAHQYTLLNPGSDVTVVLDGSLLDGQEVTLTAADLGLPKAQRFYKAMTFMFERDFDGTWSLSGNYTYAKNVGNIEGGVRSDNGQTDSGLTTAFDYPSLVNGAYGYLPTDVRHAIKAYGSYQISELVSIGLQAQATSPRKYGCLGLVPNSVDGGAATPYGASGFYCVTDLNGNVLTQGSSNVNTNVGGATGRLTRRGSLLENDWQTTINLDVALRIPTDAFNASLRLSIFNLLNDKAVFDLQEVGTTDAGAPSPNYGLPLAYQTPRYVRLQFGVNF